MQHFALNTFLMIINDSLSGFIRINRMFRVFGHDRIWVLDGGLPRWRASGFDVESSASSDAILKASAASEAIEKVYQGQRVSFALPVELNFSPDFPQLLEFHLLYTMLIL